MTGRSSTVNARRMVLFYLILKGDPWTNRYGRMEVRIRNKRYMAQAIGLSERRMHRAVKGLVDAGIVERSPLSANRLYLNLPE